LERILNDALKDCSFVSWLAVEDGLNSVIMPVRFRPPKTLLKGSYMIKVFLGGTCNDSRWREELIQMLKIDYFNPVVDDWNEKAQRREISERASCDFCLYVLTPKMHGAYSIAEAIDDSNKRPKKTMFCVLKSDEERRFDQRHMKSFMQVARMIRENGGTVFGGLEDIAVFLNRYVPA